MNTLNESLKELDNFKKILSEAYGEMGGQPQGMMQQPQGQMPQQEQMMGEEGQESPLADPEMADIIDQIRQLSIQGIAKYADEVDSEQYQALKKIWLLTDKFYEDLSGDNKKK